MSNANQTQQASTKQKVERTWLGNIFHSISKTFATVGTGASAMEATTKSYGVVVMTQSKKAVKKLDDDIQKEYGMSLKEFNEYVDNIVDDFYD